MKLVYVFPVLFSLLLPWQAPNAKNENSPLTVVSYKWSRARRAVEAKTDEGAGPARAMIPQNKNFARNARVNDPAGARDPNADTLDGRSEALEKSVQESRNTKPTATDGSTFVNTMTK